MKSTMMWSKFDTNWTSKPCWTWPHKLKAGDAGFGCQKMQDRIEEMDVGYEGGERVCCVKKMAPKAGWYSNSICKNLKLKSKTITSNDHIPAPKHNKVSWHVALDPSLQEKHAVCARALAEMTGDAHHQAELCMWRSCPGKFGTAQPIERSCPDLQCCQAHICKHRYRNSGIFASIEPAFCETLVCNNVKAKKGCMTKMKNTHVYSMRWLQSRSKMRLPNLQNDGTLVL